MERALDVTQFQPLYHGQGSNPLDHISQGTILTGFEHSQEWEISRFSEQPVPEPQPPHSTLSLSLQERCFGTLVIFVALFWDNSNTSMFFLCWDIRAGCRFLEGQNLLPPLLAMLLWIEPRTFSTFWSGTAHGRVMSNFLFTRTP